MFKITVERVFDKTKPFASSLSGFIYKVSIYENYAGISNCELTKDQLKKVNLITPLYQSKTFEDALQRMVQIKRSISKTKWFELKAISFERENCFMEFVPVKEFVVEK